MRRRGLVLGRAVCLAAALLAPIVGALPAGAARQPGVEIVPGMEILRDVWCTSGGHCLGVGSTYDGFGGVVVLRSLGPPGPVQRVTDTSSLTAITCVPGGNCIAVGQGWDGPAVIEVTAGGTPGAVRLVQGATFLYDLACPTATTCLTTGTLAPPLDSGDHSPGPPVFAVITNGQPAPARPFPVQNGRFGGIACPTTITCVAVGGRVAVLSDAGVGWTARIGSEGPPGSGYVGEGISCPTSSRCYATAVGVVPVGGNSFITVPATVAVTADGIAGPVQILGTNTGNARAISCAPGTAMCTVVGDDTQVHQAVHFVVSRGSPGPPVYWSNASWLTGVSCPSGTGCGVVGGRSQIGVFGWKA